LILRLDQTKMEVKQRVFQARTHIPANWTIAESHRQFKELLMNFVIYLTKLIKFAKQKNN